jgi:uncharacterized protein with von Willebrand factor type A (vWA) domain
VGAAPGVVVVVDWSLPLEDQSTLETFAQRRAQVAREVKRRLGGSVSDVVLYSEIARVGSVSDLDSRVPLDVVYGSNLQHGLRLARGVCEASGTWRIVLITSSAPSAHLQPNGTPFFSFPTVRATLLATAEEISEFEQADLRVDTVVLGGYDDEAHDRLVALTSLMEDLTEPLSGCVVGAEAAEPTTILVDRFLTAAGFSFD